MTNKDFLSQFSGDNKKPDSFKEEERVKVTKDKKPVNVKLIVIILAIVLAIAGLVLFLVLRPTIEVRDFVGTNAAEVKAWIKQNDIESQGVIFREEYSFDYDEGYIIYQSIEPDKKIRKNTKMDFTVSMGADPDELISVPDIETMYKDELQEWVKQNKLTKTKIMSQYSDTVEDGAVISYEFKGSDADTFTRSSILNINVSKGPAPAGTVTVEDFVKQDFSVVEAWGKKNKVEIIKTTKYDDKVLKDIVISQSIEAKKTVKEGESLTVVVSLGKAIIAKNFVGMDETELDHWATKNSAYVIKKEIYDGAKAGTVLSQSVAEGKVVEDELVVEISLGDPKLPKALNEMTYPELKQWINDVNEKGADITREHHGNDTSDTVPVGKIISLSGYTTIVECGSTVKAIVSDGKNIYLHETKVKVDGTEKDISWTDVANNSKNYTEADIRALCEASEVSYDVNYGESADVDVNKAISVSRSNGVLKDETYITQSEIIRIVICEKKTTN